MSDLPRPEHLATPRAVRASVWAVAFTWAAATVSATLALVASDWPRAIMALVAACNAAGWLMATRRWVEWSTVAVGLLATLEAHGVRYWLDEPPEPFENGEA